eukprot:scaffold194227_cov19-Tisochrysis_lutea.AAC.1
MPSWRDIWLTCVASAHRGSTMVNTVQYTAQQDIVKACCRRTRVLRLVHAPVHCMATRGGIVCRGGQRM